MSRLKPRCSNRVRKAEVTRDGRTGLVFLKARFLTLVELLTTGNINFWDKRKPGLQHRRRTSKKNLQRTDFPRPWASFGCTSPECHLWACLGTPHACSVGSSDSGPLTSSPPPPYHVETSDEVTWTCTSLKLSASLRRAAVKEHTDIPQ